MKVLGSVCVAVVLSICLAATLPCHAAEEDAPPSDKNVKGLWLTITNLPKDAEPVHFEEEDNGAVTFLHLVEDGMVSVSVERTPLPDGDVEKNIIKRIAELKEIDKKAIKLTPSEDLSAQYSYPSYIAEYKTGANEDSQNVLDFCMPTDDWLFRVSVSASADYEGDYKKQAMDWFKSLELRD